MQFGDGHNYQKTRSGIAHGLYIDRQVLELC